MLCLHTPRADCNQKHGFEYCVLLLCLHTPRADCNGFIASQKPTSLLCLHTPRADCNTSASRYPSIEHFFASTRPVQIATASLRRKRRCMMLCLHTPRADCNCKGRVTGMRTTLCLHTPRADCNLKAAEDVRRFRALPPHAPCRLQHVGDGCGKKSNALPPHAPCRLQPCLMLLLRRFVHFASTRPVQIATAEMHRIAICTFQNVC